MKAEVHYAKAQRLNAAQLMHNVTPDWEAIIELIHLSAHHYVLAGTEWAGVQHKQSHPHSNNQAILKQANAPSEVQNAWFSIETLRAGNSYGAKSDPQAGSDARKEIAIIAQWVDLLRLNQGGNP